MSSNAPQLDLLPALRRIHDYLETFLNKWIAIPHAEDLAQFQLEAIHPLNPASGDGLAIQIVCTPPYFPPLTGKSRPKPVKAWVLYCWYPDATGYRYCPLSTYTEPASVAHKAPAPWRARERLRGILSALNTLIIDYQTSGVSIEDDPFCLDKEERSRHIEDVSLRLGPGTATCASCETPIQVDVDEQMLKTCLPCRLILRNPSYLKSRRACEPVL